MALIIQNKTTDQSPDDVNHPAHYITESGMEAITVIEAFTGDAMTWSMGNVLKYICRWKKKGGLKDLKKARWYLDRLIGIVEERTEHQ